MPNFAYSKFTLSFLVILGLALSFFASGKFGNSGMVFGQSNSTGGQAQSVEVVHPTRMKMSRSLDVPATIEAIEQVDIYAKVSGYISEVNVDIGSSVKAGDVLAVIDIPEMQNDLNEAKARLIVAESNVKQAESKSNVARSEAERRSVETVLQETRFHRKEALFQEKAITAMEFDEAKSQWAVAQAEINIAKSRITAAESDLVAAQSQVTMAQAQLDRVLEMANYTMITAPFDGIVTKRMVDRGALVQSAISSRSMALFTLQRIDTVRIYIEVPETDVPFVKPETAVKVKPYGRSGKELDCKITKIASSLNPATRTMRAAIDIPNPDFSLLHGMYARVMVEIDPRPNALTIPATALLTEGSDKYVYVVENDQATKRVIKTGLDDGIRIEVTEGLQDSDTVVVTGKGLVSSGMRVRPVMKTN